MKQLRIANPWAGAPVYFESVTRSTMEDAWRLLRQGCQEGTVVAAGRQDMGRGRVPGRSWLAEQGQSLLFTLVLRGGSSDGSAPASAQRGAPLFPPAEHPILGPSPQSLPVLAGLAVCLVLEQRYALSVQIKWPNDILLEGKKLAGILCEAAAEGENLGVLVGIGLNCNQLEFPAELAGSAVSLRQALGEEVDPLSVLEPLLGCLKAVLGDVDWKERVEKRLFALGREVVLRPITPPSSAADPSTSSEQRGILRGLAEDGALLLEQRGSRGAIRLYSGEMSLASGPRSRS